MTAAALPFSPAAERNRAPLLAVLERVLPAAAQVLEIASGTGQHAAHFAAAQPGWQWQPTDLDEIALAAIDARCAGLANVAPARRLDVLAPPPLADAAPLDAIVCANMLHISPWATCAALMALAGARLRPGGVLVLYGPYAVAGEPLAPGNAAFDADLRARDARWGLRLLGDVVAEARPHGLTLEERIAMPANNLSLVFRRQG